MKNLNFLKIKEDYFKSTKKPQELEQLPNGNEYTVEEQALAFLTDAGLVGRYTMSLPRTPTKIKENP